MTQTALCPSAGEERLKLACFVEFLECIYNCMTREHVSPSHLAVARVISAGWPINPIKEQASSSMKESRQKADTQPARQANGDGQTGLSLFNNSNSGRFPLSDACLI